MEFWTLRKVLYHFKNISHEIPVDAGGEVTQARIAHGMDSYDIILVIVDNPDGRAALATGSVNVIFEQRSLRLAFTGHLPLFSPALFSRVPRDVKGLAHVFLFVQEGLTAEPADFFSERAIFRQDDDSHVKIPVPVLDPVVKGHELVGDHASKGFLILVPSGDDLNAFGPTVVVVDVHAMAGGEQNPGRNEKTGSHVGLPAARTDS